MSNIKTDIWVGNTSISTEPQKTTGSYVQLWGETYYRITHVDQMPPFFMSLVSASDHWLFIASNGGLTAGRAHADIALFPYETEDKITAHHEQTGSKTILRVTRDGRSHLWEPFSERYAGLYHGERHLYKNIPGNKLVFEEINHSLGLTLRTAWRTGDRLGFIRTCWLRNNNEADCQVELLDGLQNLLPAGAITSLQTSYSNLLDAYKRNELVEATGLGLFSLSATLTDRAEPSESLLATVAWQAGLDDPLQLLSSEQIDLFRHGRSLSAEQDVRGKAGAYLVNAGFSLAAQEEKQWHIVADVNQDSAAVVRLNGLLAQDHHALAAEIEADVAAGTAVLVRIVAAADGLQQTASQTITAHHFANVLFNIMRGGIFDQGYQIDKEDWLRFLQVRNRIVLQTHADWLAALPAQLTNDDLHDRAATTRDPNLVRLCNEYLPLAFSRRHGDPSRPWNHFTINLKQPDGSPRRDYQGNWRDIFQNWEALAYSFPDYVTGMVAIFLNATTADGYNPYRLTRDGLEWEVPEPDNPWANIGYWSDHQIIYLQKLLEIATQVNPRALPRCWNHPIFTYANVPYRLRAYREMLADWYNTIDFDWEGEQESVAAVARMGTDGRLLRDADDHIIHVTMAEKLLVLLLAKLTNLVPEGGIWMNTQRPEWNDANNALVGKGLSVVTVAYLRRFIAFWRTQLTQAAPDAFTVNTAVAALFKQVQQTLAAYQPHLESGFSDEARLAFMDGLGTAVSAYRATIYDDGLPLTQAALTGQAVSDLLALAQAYLDHTLLANRRQDHLFHAYNVLHVQEQGAGVEHLYLMLEGQVAILSSGLLSASETVSLLHSLRHSDLYRADQHSYMLYPNRALPGFLQKNNVSAQDVAGSGLVATLAAASDSRLLVRDEMGDYHFNGRFRNAAGVSKVLDQLAQEPAYTALVAAERDFILNLFEQTFNHQTFTGRSGTFFAFEGLGSVYWHMVSKLLLAVQECYQQAVVAGEDTAVTAALAGMYYDIRGGIGFNKSPDVYGAFPTDPYSHTPLGSGARQPGMTGQVKEEILTRWGELGVALQAGTLQFAPTLLQADEFLPDESSFTYVDVLGETNTISLPPRSLAFTICQTPVVYTQAEVGKITVVEENGRITNTQGAHLDIATTHHILNRDGHIKQVSVTVSIV